MLICDMRLLYVLTGHFVFRAVRHLEGLCLEKPQELVFEQLQHQYKLWKYWMSLETKNFRKDINNREGDVSTSANHCQKYAEKFI